MTRKAGVLAAALADIRAFCQQHADEVQAQRYTRFFTEGYDAYGISKDVWEANETRFFEKYRDLGLEGLLDLGDLLFESGKYEEASFAVTTIAPLLDQFTPAAFQRVGGWLERGVRNWAHSDVICGRLLGPCLQRRVVGLPEMAAWRRSSSKWKRRAVPVSMLALLQGPGKSGPWLKFVEPLMLDDERVVHQGVGWFLRELWKKGPDPVENLLFKYRDRAARLIFQYATEKMTPEQKQRFRKTVSGKPELGRKKMGGKG